MNRCPTTSSPHAHGFTLVELTLAIVVGSMVLLGVAGVFAAARNMDRVFGDQYNNTTELHIAQMTIRRTLLTLQIEEDRRQSASDSAGVDTSDATPIEDRSRIILEPDPVYADIFGPWQPQRFEVVVSTPPIALNMATKAAAWARINDRDEDSLDFSSEDASGGVLRSVFELRPDGHRERIMRGVGIMDPDPKADQLDSQIIQEQSTGWTLWWRPILRTEARFLRAGGLPMADAAGIQDEIRFRLAGAIPLVTNIDVCSWTVYKGDEKVTDYQAQSMSDLPAYAEFELMLTNGKYASWMFEIDWVLGDDPLDIIEDDSNGGVSGDGSGDDSGGGGNGIGDDAPGDRPGGGGIDNPGGNNHNMGGGDT